MGKEWSEIPDEWCLIDELNILRELDGDDYRQQRAYIVAMEPQIGRMLPGHPVHSGQVECVIIQWVAREDRKLWEENYYRGSWDNCSGGA